MRQLISNDRHRVISCWKFANKPSSFSYSQDICNGVFVLEIEHKLTSNEDRKNNQVAIVRFRTIASKRVNNGSKARRCSIFWVLISFFNFPFTSLLVYRREEKGRWIQFELMLENCLEFGVLWIFDEQHFSKANTCGISAGYTHHLLISLRIVIKLLISKGHATTNSYCTWRGWSTTHTWFRWI